MAVRHKNVEKSDSLMHNIKYKVVMSQNMAVRLVLVREKNVCVRNVSSRKMWLLDETYEWWSWVFENNDYYKSVICRQIWV